jgi:hypothetical protein
MKHAVRLRLLPLKTVGVKVVWFGLGLLSRWSKDFWKYCNVLNCSLAVVLLLFKLGVVLSVKRCGFVIFNGTGERSLLV